jgi:hypothetical protein
MEPEGTITTLWSLKNGAWARILAAVLLGLGVILVNVIAHEYTHRALVLALGIFAVIGVVSAINTIYTLSGLERRIRGEWV